MLGNEILKQRLALGLSINALSELTDVPCANICALENGTRKCITKKTLKKLNKVLNLKDEYAFDTTNVKLAKLLRLKREEKGYSQTEIAILAGYNNSTKINHLENCRTSKITYTTFLRLQKILDLDYEEFKPFIIPILEEKGNQIHPNRELIQKLVKEKRNISIKELSKVASISPATIVRIESHPEKDISINSIIKLIKFLKFTKEEIMLCLGTDDEEIINAIQKDEEKKYVR